MNYKDDPFYEPYELDEEAAAAEPKKFVGDSWNIMPNYGSDILEREKYAKSIGKEGEYVELPQKIEQQETYNNSSDPFYEPYELDSEITKDAKDEDSVSLKKLFDRMGTQGTATGVTPEEYKNLTNDQVIERQNSSSDPFYEPYELDDEYQLPTKRNIKNKSVIDKMLTSANKGLSRSVSRHAAGLAFGTPEEEAQADGIIEYISEFGGQLAGDMPAFMAGGQLGALIGAAAGSVIPGVGTAVGATIGAAFTGMALPTMLNSSFDEYKKFIKGGGEATFGGFLESVGDIAAETGKAGAVGLVTANMGRLVPFMKKVPYLNKLLNTSVGRKVTSTGLEFTGLTAAQALLDGSMPTKEQLRDNAMAVISMKILHKFGAPIKSMIPEKVKSAPRTLIEKLPKSISKPINKAINYSETVKAEVLNKHNFDLLKEHVGEREAKITREHFDLMEKTHTKTKENTWKPKFTKQELNDMTFFRQGTANLKGESLEKMSKRMSPEAKHFATVEFTNIMEKALKELNSNERIPKINPRSESSESYITGFYEGDIKKAMQKLGKKLGASNKNMFANYKTFETFIEAFQETGLTPKFKDLPDFAAKTIEVKQKLIAASDVIDVLDKPLIGSESKVSDNIVRAHEGERYREAKLNGFVAMNDDLLKRYKDSDGKWQTSTAPVLVAPKIADAFQGMLRKGEITPDSKFWKSLDNMSGVISAARVVLSPFHAVALTESSLGALGAKKALNLPWIAEKGRELRANVEFMSDAHRHGLKTDKLINVREGTNLMDRAVDFVSKQASKLSTAAFNSDAAVKSGTEKLKKGLNYLFDQYHPNLKTVTYDELTRKAFADMESQGKKINSSERSVIKRQMAELVNNIYGGQNWETMKFFNDPKNLKKIRRIIGYPDWTFSALKQAGGTLSKGLPGKMSRNYWRNYILKVGLSQAAFRFLSSGLEQTDKRNKKITGIRWSGKKARKEFWEGDPSKWYMFPLPDVDIKLKNSYVFNPGRSSNGKKLYGHFGKQALEILGWGQKPLQTFFGKSNPLLQIAFQQAAGGTPYEGGIFPARGKYSEAQFKPWDAETGVRQVIPRAKALAQSVMPFSISSLQQKGIGAYLGSAGGAFPVSQGMSLKKAEGYIEKALKEKDYKMINRIKRILLENGYKNRSIKAVITKMKNRLKLKS